jgi:hypothetical protein
MIKSGEHALAVIGAADQGVCPSKLFYCALSLVVR